MCINGSQDEDHEGRYEEHALHGLARLDAGHESDARHAFDVSDAEHAVNASNAEHVPNAGHANTLQVTHLLRNLDRPTHSRAQRNIGLPAVV
ncbi:hypothetical protein [Mycobacterium asiaticum]|uniref:hypothetical protein n=1 Tax=Mycobacterium asiaticum TaxID=1790 RepID=UPI0012DB0189|nr:hypothetical protein [Mycobacterium asiaticum]